MAKLLHRIGLFSARRAWVIVAFWAVLLAATGGSYAAFGGNLVNSFTLPGSETQRLADELEQKYPDANQGTGQLVVSTADGSAITDEQQQALTDALTSAENIPGVASIQNPYQTEQQKSDAEQQLDEAQQNIDSAPEQFAQAHTQIDGAQSDIDAGQAQLDAAPQQLDEAQTQIDSGRQQVAAGQVQIDTAQAQLDASIAEAGAAGILESQQATFTQAQAQITAQQQELDQTVAQLDESQRQVDEQRQSLPQQQEELNQARADLDEQKQALQAQEEAFPQQKADYEYNRALYNLAQDYTLVSSDGSTAVAILNFDEASQNIPQSTKDEVMQHFENAHLAGLQTDFDANIAENMTDILGVGEVIGVVVALIVLVIMLGTLVAAGLPVVMALIGVAVGVLGSLAFSSVVEMNSITPVLGIMLALAVGIDYSLFILNRHRNNLARGMKLEDSIALANGTSGNAVVFAGTTVIIALLALNVTGVPFLAIMGNVAAVCVAIAVLVAVTLTPAALALIGRRVMPKRAWARIEKVQKSSGDTEHDAEVSAAVAQHEQSPRGWIKLVTGHPIIVLLTGLVALMLLALPVGQMRLGLPDASSADSDSTQYRAYQLVDEKFGAGMNGPVVVVADIPDHLTDEQAKKLQIQIGEQLAEAQNVETVVPVAISEDRTIEIFQVVPTDGPTAESTEDLVNHLRTMTVMGDDGQVTTLGVTGQTGGNIDISQILAGKLPLYLGIVLGLSFIILILVFRSLVVPLMATVGFLFSVLASFGAVVAVYQWGWLGSLFGVHDPGPIISFLPTLMIGILFGLAMDYQVFLVSGMREAYVHGRSARAAVVAGYQSSVRVVVAAAIIMIAVFSGFIHAELTTIHPLGFGLAFGVLIDAFVVRMTLVPAAMQLTGEKAWWLPAWLDRILPRMDVEGSSLQK